MIATLAASWINSFFVRQREKKENGQNRHFGGEALLAGRARGGARLLSIVDLHVHAMRRKSGPKLQKKNKKWLMNGGAVKQIELSKLWVGAGGGTHMVTTNGQQRCCCCCPSSFLILGRVCPIRSCESATG